MIIEAITLHRFCTFTGDEYDRPLRLAGGTAATNRALLIWVPTPYDYDTPRAEPAKSMERWVRRAKEAAVVEPGTWRNVADIRLHGRGCRRCEGRGHVNTRSCNDCDGSGVFEHGRYTYDCKECDGSGKIAQSATSADPVCDACGGTCLAADVTDFRITGHTRITANQQMIELLRGLPNAQLRQEPLRDTGRENMLAIRFDGGIGVLMPMYGEPLPNALAAVAEGGAP